MRKHRTPEQWQALVDQQRVSGLSAPQFCKQENIGYASFCNWRKRLSDPSTDDSAGSGCQWPFILTHLWPIKLTHPL
jgi:hypothetical protein